MQEKKAKETGEKRETFLLMSGKIVLTALLLSIVSLHIKPVGLYFEKPGATPLD